MIWFWMEGCLLFAVAMCHPTSGTVVNTLKEPENIDRVNQMAAMYQRA